MSERINLPKEKFESVVEKGWEILVGTTLEGVPLESTPFDAGSFQMLGLCFMRSPEKTLLLTCRSREPVARAVASSLFDDPEDEVTREELDDAFAELTNIIAGNTRSMLPENYDSDLPMVVSGEGLKVSLGDTKTLLRTFFRGASGIIEITVRTNF